MHALQTFFYTLSQTGVKTFPKPKGIPENYRVGLSDNGVGMMYVHVNHTHTSIRVVPGKPHSQLKHQQHPYIKQMRDGDCLDNFGSVVPKESSEAHIPII